MYGKTAVHPVRRSEEELVLAAKGGDKEAIEHLLVSHPPIEWIIRSLSRHHDPAGHAEEELAAAARLGLLEALRGFEPNRGAKFTTYAFNFIRGEMIKALYSKSQRRERAAGRPAVALIPLQSTSIGGGDPEDLAGGGSAPHDDRLGVEEEYASVERHPSEEAVRTFVAGLPQNQRAIVHDVFWREMSHTQAAERRGVSRPAVSRTLSRVYRRGREDLAAHREVLAA
jgi:RNA polymerase sigma factor (sigma-70 family)